jgi:hypothetical protein
MPPFTMFTPKCVDNHHTWSCNFDKFLNFSKNEKTIKTLITLEGIMSFTTKKSMITSLKWLYLWLSHKLLFWIPCVKIHNYILVGHVINRWWSGNKMQGVSFHHLYFIYMASMINDKMSGFPILITLIKKWLCNLIWT